MRRCSSATTPPRDIYIRLKHKAAGEVGINPKDIRLASQTTEAELLEQVAQLNADNATDGLLVQLPLPDHIDEARVIRAIDPAKDVDGLQELRLGRLRCETDVLGVDPDLARGLVLAAGC